MKYLKYYWNWFMYKNAILDDKCRYLLAKEKGCYCVGINNGIAKFYPSKPPQEKNWLDWEEYKQKWHPVTGELAFKPNAKSRRACYFSHSYGKWEMISFTPESETGDHHHHSDHAATCTKCGYVDINKRAWPTPFYGFDGDRRWGQTAEEAIIDARACQANT